MTVKDMTDAAVQIAILKTQMVSVEKSITEIRVHFDNRFDKIEKGNEDFKKDIDGKVDSMSEKIERLYGLIEANQKEGPKEKESGGHGLALIWTGIKLIFGAKGIPLK